jgi:hypothetical protein
MKNTLVISKILNYKIPKQKNLRILAFFFEKSKKEACRKSELSAEKFD